MPSHSHSSHSSHSHSSHHSSSHSHSSHSSYSHSSGGGGSSYYRSRPVQPVFSKSSSSFVRSGNVVGNIIARERHNQPIGFNSIYPSAMTSNYYAEKHNYVYYPHSWLYQNVEYKKGYYDENGNYYDRIVFEYDGVYRGLECKCEYCGSVTKMDWRNGEALNCPNCGGKVDILTPIDAYTQDPEYTKYVEEVLPKYQKEAAEYEQYQQSNKNITKIVRGIVITHITIFCIIFSLVLFGMVYDGDNSTYSGAPSNTEIWGRTIYLEALYDGTGAYRIIEDPDSISGYDKKLTWVSSEDSYYDPDSDCYIWYNTDVAPNLWQYYYNGISDNYPESCGWLEYEPSGWWIEISYNEWVRYYDVDERFWHIEIDPKDFE